MEERGEDEAENGKRTNERKELFFYDPASKTHKKNMYSKHTNTENNSKNLSSLYYMLADGPKKRVVTGVKDYSRILK